MLETISKLSLGLSWILFLSISSMIFVGACKKDGMSTPNDGGIGQDTMVPECHENVDCEPAGDLCSAGRCTCHGGAPCTNGRVCGPSGCECASSQVECGGICVDPADCCQEGACIEDGNECTQDLCDAQGIFCERPSVADGTLCRQAAQICEGGACTSCLEEPVPLAVSAAGRVITLYLAAVDTPLWDIQEREAAFNRAMIQVQHFYSEAMGEEYGYKTFPYEPTHVLPSTLTRQQWEDAGAVTCGIYDAAFEQLTTGGLLADAGLPSLGTPGVVYMVIGGGGYQGGCGSSWMAACEELGLERLPHRCPNGRYDGCDRNCSDPDGLAEIDPWCELWPHTEEGYGCAPFGGLAHELGHGFGLPHGADRPTSTGVTIMDEWWNYDRGAVLSVEDRQDLDLSPYFAAPQ